MNTNSPTIAGDLASNLTGIAIGVRFSPTFAVADNLGKIADKILYEKDSYFNPDLFPYLDSDFHAKCLKSSDGLKYLIISTTDMIVEMNGLRNSALKCLDIENAFEKQIINGVFKTYEVREIRRIGYLSKFCLENKTLAELFLKKTGVSSNNISLRFQKNHPLPISMQKKEVDDYCSNIYTIIKKPDSNELLIRSDYQVNFKPPLDDVDDIRYRVFLNEQKKFNSSLLIDWLNEYLVEK